MFWIDSDLRGLERLYENDHFSLPLDAQSKIEREKTVRQSTDFVGDGDGDGESDGHGYAGVGDGDLSDCSTDIQ